MLKNVAQLQPVVKSLLTSISHEARWKVTLRRGTSETLVPGKNVPPVSAVCIFLSWHIEWNPLEKPPTPPQPSLASSCSLSAPLAATFTAHHSTELARRQEGRRQRGEGSGRMRRNLEEENLLVAPTERAVGQRVEIRVRGYSWKVCRIH